MKEKYMGMITHMPNLSPEEVQRRIDEESANIDAFCRRMFGDGEPEEPEDPIDWDYWAGKYEEDRIDESAFPAYFSLSEALALDYDNNGAPIYAIGSVDEIPDSFFTNPLHSVALPPFSPKIARAIGLPAKALLIKKNIFEKNRDNHGEVKNSKDILKGALYGARVAIRDKPQTKSAYWVVVKQRGKYVMATLDFTASKRYIEVVNWRAMDTKGYNKIIHRAMRNNGDIQVVDWDA